MLRFILNRLFQAVPTLLAIATLTFFLIRLAPGGPFSTEKSVAPEILARLNEHYGLDKPMIIQYGDYMLNLLRGNLGPSFKYPNRTVNELIAGAAPVSFELGMWALLFALVAGLTAGIIAVSRPNTLFDHLPMGLAMTGICVPTFVLGPLLVLGIALKLGWLSVSGWVVPGDRILPALTLGAPYAAYIARLTRGGLMEMLPQDFIRTARAKGLPEHIVIFRHALKGGLLPVVSFLGPAVAGLVTGSFVVETIFQVPGLGRFFIMAAFNRDYTMIMGTVLFYATLIIVLNMLVDIMQAWMDPRVRLGE
jgi:oligopeptide transport system permease protein